MAILALNSAQKSNLGRKEGFLARNSNWQTHFPRPPGIFLAEVCIKKQFVQK